MKHILSIGFLVTSASFPLSSMSADNPATEIPAVVVSAARTEQSTLTTPASITVITRKDISRSGASHVVDVLRGYGGLYVRDTFGDGSRASVSMRGFGSSANANTLILVDGRRLNNSDISSPDLNSISLQDVERIEIVQGSAGVLYGDQAVGGVINIITSDTGGEEATVEVAVGSYDAASLRAVYGNSYKNKLNYRVSTEVRKSDNYRRENNEVEYANVFAKTDYDYTDGRVFAEVQHVKEDLQLPGSLLQAEVDSDRRQTYVDFLNDFTNSETDVARFGVNHSLNENWLFEAEATYRNVERYIQQSFRGFVIDTTSKLKRKQAELTPRLVAVYPVDNGEIQLTAGVDVIDTDFESEITSSENRQKMLAEYVQVAFPVHEKLNLTVGFRHAEVEDNVISTFTNGKQEVDADVAEFGMVYKLNDRLKIFGRAEQTFRFAKVDELTYVSPGSQLKAQTGESFETGIEYQKGTSTSKVVVYKLALDDEIAFDSSAPQPVGAFFAGANVNFDPTTHQGVIVESRYDIVDDLNLSASYSYTDATFDSGVYADKRISGVPENTGRINANYALTDSFDVNLGVVYTGSRYLAGDNDNAQSKISGYSVLSLNLAYVYNDWELNLKVNNLTDRKYIENANSFGSRFPMPERNFLLTAAWNFR